MTALSRFKQRGATILAINGGDGTVRDVLTALWRIDPDWCPALSIIPGGKTNLIAYDVGSVTHGPAGLRQIMEAASNNRLDRHRCSRRVLDIVRQDSALPPVCGLFFGAGAFSAGTELSQKEANALGLYQGLAVALTIGSMVVRQMRGGGSGGANMTLSADGRLVHDGDHFIMLATSLQRIIMGLNPFWGPHNRAIRFTDIAGPPVRLTSALVPVLRGRPKPWMHGAGYHSASADHLSLRLTSRFTVDGELYDPGPCGMISLSARRSMDFVHP